MRVRVFDGRSVTITFFFLYTCLCSCAVHSAVIRPKRVVLSSIVRPTLTAPYTSPMLYGTKTDRGQGGLRCSRTCCQPRDIGVGRVKIYPCETHCRPGGTEKNPKRRAVKRRTLAISYDVAVRGTTGERDRG